MYEKTKTVAIALTSDTHRYCACEYLEYTALSAAYGAATCRFRSAFSHDWRLGSAYPV